MIVIKPDPDHYDQQFQEKISTLETQFSRFSPPRLETFPSPPLGYRQRAEFKIWHEGDKSHYAVFSGGKDSPPTFVDTFPVASPVINHLMPTLRQTIEQNEILRKRLFQIEFLSSTTGDVLMTLIYHKPLDETWITEAKKLSETTNALIIGRSRKQKIVLDRDYINECFIVDCKKFHYRQLEGSFSQPNAAACQSMLNWATDCASQINPTNEKTNDLLELYCGNGNFTLPLSRHFDKVLATEISKSLTTAAKINCTENHIDNIAFARMAADEISSAINGEREFRRLSDINLDAYHFSTVFVDPPRAGLDKATENMVQQFDHILYISCNPDTLEENLNTLCDTHTITRFAFFDQFPYTHHKECGVLLKKK